MSPFAEDLIPIEARFALEERVGRGASGDVHRARDRRTGEVVAVKRLHPVPDDDDGRTLDRFRREAHLLAQIDHPNVVRYLAHGVDAAGRPCLVVEWLEGEDLSRRQRRAALTVAESLDVARQIALGLAALHDAGVVHRDVKPANVFLLDDGRGGSLAKLIDLGVARTAGESTLTAAGLAVGTPAYMSPEQVRGDERITGRADQFSLGVLLFELLTGRRPFTGDDPFAVVAKIALSDPPRLRDVLPGAPEAAEAILACALRKDPLDRYPSARHLADAILDILPWDASAAPVDPADDAPTARAAALISTTSEQRVVTALFAAFPPSAGEAEHRAFAAAAEQQGGACHGTLGHRMIAVFGGARSTGDEAVRAARAALAARDRVPGVQLAVATGRALAGVTGLSGDLIERGARAVDPREPTAIRLDEPTARLLGDHFVLEDQMLIGARPFAGAAAPPRTVIGKAAPLVGRDREIASLIAAFAECVDEPVARAVVVTGPPGIGKTRLRHELLARVADRDLRPQVLLARGSPLAVDAAFGLIAPLVRRFAGILDGEPAADQWRKLSARVGRLVPADTAALLGELASLPPAGGAARPRRDAVVSGDLLRNAWIEWLEAECAERPVVIVLEDLHWGDRASVAFVGAALRALADKPLFVAALGRSELYDRFPGAWMSESALSLRLSPLTPRAGERLVRSLLGPAAGDAVVQRIVARAEGNAFYLEELVRAVSEGPGDALPDTVLGMVQARLDALGHAPKRVLRAASVFGQTFWLGGVAALLGEAPEAVADALDRLAAADVVARRDRSSFPGELEYVFRHALVRDAAYAMIPDDDRLAGHRLAGAFLERAGEVDPALLAAHFEHGGDLPRAAALHLAAADKALAGNDFTAAAALADRAVGGGAGGEDRGRARLIQAEAHRWRGEMAQAAAAALEAVELLPRHGALWFHAAREAIAAGGRLGRFDLVAAWAGEVARAAAAPDAAGAQLAALVPGAVQMIYAGDTERAAGLLLDIERLQITAGRLDPAVAARLHQMRAVLADHDRDLESALASHEAALDAFERAGDRRGACLTLSNMAFIQATLGAFTEAHDALRRVHATATRLGLGTVAPLSLHNLGGVLASLGRLDEARAVEEEAVRAFAAASDPRLEGASRVYLSRILLAQGDAAAAEAEARRVVENPASPVPLCAGAQAARAAALLALGRVPEALASASEAAQKLATLGAMEDFEALVGLAHAEALAASGDPEAARAAVAAACQRIHARAARLREATRARFLGAVPDNVRCLALAQAWGVALPAAASS